MNALDAERTKEWDEYRNWLAPDLYEHEGPSYWPTFRTDVTQMLIGYNTKFGWPLPWETEDRAECWRILRPDDQLRGRRSVDPDRPLERDWIVELNVRPPGSHPDWLNSLFDSFPRRYRWKGDAENCVHRLNQEGGTATVLKAAARVEG